MAQGCLENRKILIVGLGLIGGSYAEALSFKGFEVGAVDVRDEAINFALRNGFISHGTTSPTEEYIGRFDIIVLALYPHDLQPWVLKYQSCFKRNVLLTDVTGVKGAIVGEIESILREDAVFVPAHPMAGRELNGVENSDCRIFQGANFIITPSLRSTNEGIDTVSSLAKALGFTRISTISIEEHDEMVAFLSQLTHCIAVSLMTCKPSSHLAAYTGDSFRDLTRIARINENMWTELFLANRTELLAQMDLFLRQFVSLREALASFNVETLKQMMRLSTERRKFFDKDN